MLQKAEQFDPSHSSRPPNLYTEIFSLGGVMETRVSFPPRPMGKQSVSKELTCFGAPHTMTGTSLTF